jgi:hypothetical protein
MLPLGKSLQIIGGHKTNAITTGNACSQCDYNQNITR